jgi:hypothetical protein
VNRNQEVTVHEAKRWTVSIDIDEHEGRTRAVARLHTPDTDSVVGVGLARLNPTDRDVPEIGDELAAARALSELTHRLLGVVTDDLEKANEPARQGG